MTEPAAAAPEDRRALYLRWRPRSFSDVVGQEAVVRTLRNAVTRGTVAHGYLLCGPRGTGKTSLARILYKALNCERPVEGDPCGSCASCLASDAGRALDLIEIDAASNRGIDDIRALRERARFAPTDAKTKVYIVDEAHQLTQPAWDAFLKTLEEPPPNTVFVLATTAAHKVPATIVSRCQRFDLGRIPQVRIADHLAQVANSEGIELESGVAERVARLARGGMRDALSMLEQLAAFGGSPVTVEAARRVLGLVRGDALQAFVDALAGRDARRAFLLLEDIAQEGADLRQFLDEILLYLRAILKSRVGADEAISADFGPEEQAWIRAVAQQWGPGEVAEILRSFGELGVAGLDERQLLTRLELATATATRVQAAASAATSAAARLEPSAPATGSGGAANVESAVLTGADLKAALAAMAPAPPPASVSKPSDPSPPARPPWEDDPIPPDDIVEEFSDASAAKRSLAVAPAGVGSAVDTRDPVETAAQPLAASDAHPAAGPPPGATVRTPSLATLQARWPLILDRLQGSLRARMLLAQVVPVALDSGVATLEGPLDYRDLDDLKTQYSKVVESALEQELAVGLRVTFRGATQEAAAESEPDDGPSLLNEAARLFGGQLIAVSDDEA